MNIGLTKNVTTLSNKKRDLDVVFLGDSITEGWNGRMMGNPTISNADQSRVFHNLFRTQGLALGVAADSAANLLYRIRNSMGELPQNPPKVWWILIGINDLDISRMCSREATLAGTLTVVRELQQRSDNDDSIIVINSILPTTRGGGSLTGKPIWEQRISWVNHRLECYAKLTPGVEFFNATDIFLSGDGTRINTTLLPDKLHPSSIGYELWGGRILDKLSQLSVNISHTMESPTSEE
jgi:lysophospholipase L1-like esterase